MHEYVCISAGKNISIADWFLFNEAKYHKMV